MLDYSVDQQQKDTQSEGVKNQYLAGITDGSHGYPLRLKFMHDIAYMKGYVVGISQWVAELERREIENYGDSAFEF